MSYEIGDVIKINHLCDEPPGTYEGRKGVITDIDIWGTLFGTWGELGVIPENDDIEIITEN